MTVKELRELLTAFPDDAKVVLIDMDSILQSERIDVTEVELEKDGRSVIIE